MDQVESIDNGVSCCQSTQQVIVEVVMLVEQYKH